MTFVTVIYGRGERWDAANAFNDQIGIMGHAEFLRARYADGTLYCGGPFADDAGGVAIYRCLDRDAVAALVATDPCVAGGLLTAEIHPMWLPFPATTAHATAASDT